MRAIIAGSRWISDIRLVAAAVAASGIQVTQVVCGDATGVDTLGRCWAEGQGIAVKRFPANWAEHGKAAGYKRNIDMLNYAEALIAVWDGQSRGTKHMIQIATKEGIPVFVLHVAQKGG